MDPSRDVLSKMVPVIDHHVGEEDIRALATDFQTARATGTGVCSVGLSSTVLPGASFQAPISMGSSTE